MPADGLQEKSQVTISDSENRISRIFKTPFTRRDVLVGGLASGVTLAVASAVAYPKFLDQETRLEESKQKQRDLQKTAKVTADENITIGQDLDIVKRDLKQTQDKLAASNITEAEHARLVREQSRFFVQEFDQNLDIANNLVTKHLQNKDDRNKTWNFLDENALRIAFERSWTILEKGVALAASWQKLEGKKDLVGFDKDGRLVIEGRRFHVNEDVCDYHIAQNVLNAYIVSKVSEDKVDKARAEEDLRDLLRFADKKPRVEIEKTAWAVMPPGWAATLARFTMFLDDKNIPPPQVYRIARSYQRDGKEYGGGYYDSGKGKFPSEAQVLQLGSKGSPNVIYHEGGHYIADAKKIKDRLVGSERRIPHQDFQRDYDSMLGRMQKSLLLGAKKFNKDLRDWEVESAISSYAFTNTREDFAETFTFFMENGPAFRQRILDKRKTNPAAASILEAKYEFMKLNVAQGFEYGFDGRGKNTPALVDANVRIKNVNNPDNGLTGDFKYFSKSVTEEGKRIPFFKDAEIKLVVPDTDIDSKLALLEPSVWNDIINGDEVVDISNVASVAHKEFQGKIKLNLSLMTGETRSLPLDTSNTKDIEALVGVLPQIKIDQTMFMARMTTNETNRYSDDSLGYFKTLGVDPPKLAFYGAWQSSYPPDHIDRREMFFVRFQFKNGEWKQQALDLKRTRVYFRDSRDGKDGVRASDYHTMSLGEKDIMLGFDQDGRVREIRTS